MPVTTSGTDARFSTLLEPIRDLAENWSIDIASELEEYLGELEAITISFEDGRTLNFVEAAMVIQGSACIYGKKVEHLHTLVYNTLHQIVEKKKAKEAAAAAGADGEGAEEHGAGAEDGEDEDFEPLEGALAPKEVDNINLAQGGGVLKDGEGLITRLPPFLMMMQDDHMKEQLKMHACVQHASGALLLPYTDVPPAWLDAFGPGDDDVPPPPPPADPGMFDDDGVGAMDDDDDNDGGQPDFGERDWEDVATPQRGGEAMEVDATAAADGADAAADAARDHASPAGLSTPVPGSRQPAPQASPAKPAPPPKPAWDPWAPLDPHDAGNTAPRPFRKGRTYATEEAVEGSLEAMLEAAASEAAGDKENGEANGDVLCQLGLLPAAAAAGGLSTSRKLPMWSQFERLFAAEAKKRAALRRQRRQAAAERQHVGGDGDGGVIDPEVWVNEHAEERPDGELRGADDEGEGGGAHGGYFEHDDGFGGDDGHDVAPVGFDEEESTQLGPDAAHAVVAPADLDGEAEATQLGLEGQLSYEDQCRQHLETCLEATAGYHEDLALHQRVSAWRSRVTPLLEEESYRKEFNIGEYGQRLLANFEASERVAKGAKQAKRAEAGPSGGEASVLPFSEAAQCEEKYEVCRMFLAALQLTNHGNLDLVKSGSIEAGDMALSLQLLDKNRRIDFTSEEAQQLLK